MRAEFAGLLDGTGKRFGIVVARFNELVTRSLLEGALDVLRRHGTAERDIEVAWVPGAFELPMAADRLAGRRRRPVHGIIALGVILRGETPHFEYVASSTATGLALVGLIHGVPVAFGVITADTLDQAMQRAGAKAGHKGREAALAALEMASLLSQMEPS